MAKISLKKFFKLPKSKIVRLIIIATVVCLCLFAGTIYWSLNHLPPQLPLYYSLASGEEQLAHRRDLIGLPIIILTLLIGNTIIGSAVTNHWRILSRILYVQNLLILLLITITLVQIGRLIT